MHMSAQTTCKIKTLSRGHFALPQINASRRDADSARIMKHT